MAVMTLEIGFAALGPSPAPLRLLSRPLVPPAPAPAPAPLAVPTAPTPR
jgi:hypothetical protein